MSYRIQVTPDAGSLLHSFSPHVVLRLGHALAELAEWLASGEEPDGNVLQVDDCLLQFVIDPVGGLLRVVHIEQRTPLAPAWAADAAAF
jgi:hypothetical protein